MRHPDLVDLPDNTALDLGRYQCRDRVPEESLRCDLITDYSRLNYDPYNHRVLMFGGGHAATGRTDVDVLNLETLTWSSLYPSMTCAEVRDSEVDPRGFHPTTGHPVARHTYDQNVIVDVGGTGYMFMLSTEGFSGYCHPTQSPINSIARLPLEPDSTVWEFGEERRIPWGYGAGAEFDPVSGKVILVGRGRGASYGGMYVLDPESEETEYVPEVRYETAEQALVYFPPNQRMYEFSPEGVRELLLDRDDWAASTSTVMATSGMASTRNGYAYDVQNQLIGGGVTNGNFYVFDPTTATWSAHAIEVRSESGAQVGTQSGYAIDYDPVNNVYYFIAKETGQPKHVWAYRFRAP